MVIAAYSEVGKSAFAAMAPENVIDFIAMPYKYFLDTDIDNGEAGKADPDNVMRPDWPYNYVMAIKEACKEDKLILIPSDLHVLHLLREEAIPYVLVYPRRDAKEAYRKRFIDRGNTEDFIDIFIGHWNRFLDALESDPCERHIVLQPHQFIADVVDYV